MGHETPRLRNRGRHCALLAVKRVARISLGLVWLYQGLIPKIFTLVPLEREIVERVGLFLNSPQFTMRMIGIVEVLFGLWLISGYGERLACITTTLFLIALIIPSLIEEPSLLLGPFGGIIKNICLFCCAWIVWYLAPYSKK